VLRCIHQTYRNIGTEASDIDTGSVQHMNRKLEAILPKHRIPLLQPLLCISQNAVLNEVVNIMSKEVVAMMTSWKMETLAFAVQR